MIRKILLVPSLFLMLSAICQVNANAATLDKKNNNITLGNTNLDRVNDSLYEYTGEISDSSTHKGLFCSAIDVVDSNGNSYGTLTNLDGVYTICVPRGDYTLTVSKNGYNSKEIKLSIK